MKPIPFYKMSGSGNDFIIIDNRDRGLPDTQLPALIKGACRRKLSVGADGLIIVEPSAVVDFKWRFYNADGSVAEMCGNGARCAARFAFLHGIAGRQMAFETLAGIIHADVGEDAVKIRMTDPVDLRADFDLNLDGTPVRVSSINTGVPHVVMMVADVEKTDVVAMGRRIRYHQDFLPAGTNANFVSIDSGKKISIRTYERGVEDETLACGTGNVAAALILAQNEGLSSPVHLFTRSGSTLTVHFSQEANGYQNVYLEGDARVIYSAELWEDAWRE